MNAAERDFFQERAGQLAVQLMTAAFSDPGYQQLRAQGIQQRPKTRVNQELKTILQRAIQEARRAALGQLMTHEILGPDFAQSYTEFLAIQAQSDTQSVHGERQ